MTRSGQAQAGGDWRTPVCACCGTTPNYISIHEDERGRMSEKYLCDRGTYTYVEAEEDQ